MHKDPYIFAQLVKFLDRSKFNRIVTKYEGDKYIKSFAKVLERATRNTDIKCRYGADEFIVIFKRMRNEAIVTAKVEEICVAYSQVKIQDGVKPSASAGIVLCGEDTTPNAHLIECADRAMCKAKKENQGHYCVWNDQGLDD